jgi:hypothetical protein
MPFEFVDIASETLHMDLDQVEDRLRSDPERYGGILYAHTYGEAHSPGEFFNHVKGRWNHLVVIDDRCLCVPDLEPPAETGADAVLYSTGYAKIADLGLGGFAFIQDELPRTRHRLPFDERELGAMEAAYKACIQDGRVYAYRDTAWLQTDAELPAWDEFAERLSGAIEATLRHRSTINAVYNSLIPAELQLARGFQLWRFNLRLAKRDGALKEIFDAGLFASAHYRPLVGIMGEGTDTNARGLAAQVINLFNDHHFTIDMAERTARVILRSL